MNKILSYKTIFILQTNSFKLHYALYENMQYPLEESS